jgi:hypothetical protein
MGGISREQPFWGRLDQGKLKDGVLVGDEPLKKNTSAVENVAEVLLGNTQSDSKGTFTLFVDLPRHHSLHAPKVKMSTLSLRWPELSEYLPA